MSIEINYNNKFFSSASSHARTTYPQEKDWLEFEKNLPEGCSRERDHYTPLQVALMNKNIQACKTLLDGGADPNKVGKEDTPFPLYLALKQDEDLAILLVEKGATVSNGVLVREGIVIPIWLFVLMGGGPSFALYRLLLNTQKNRPQCSLHGRKHLGLVCSTFVYTFKKRGRRSSDEIILSGRACFFPPGFPMFLLQKMR